MNLLRNKLFLIVTLLTALIVMWAGLALAQERSTLARATEATLQRLLGKTREPTVPLSQLAGVAVEASGGNQSTLVSLLVQARLESAGSVRIQSGACNSDECDVRGGRHQARGLWQVHKGHSPEDIALWEQSVGLTREAMLAGATLAAKRLRVCKTLEERYAAQDGKGCRVTAMGKSRAALHRKVEAMLSRELWRLRQPETTTLASSKGAE